MGIPLAKETPFTLPEFESLVGSLREIFGEIPTLEDICLYSEFKLIKGVTMPQPATEGQKEFFDNLLTQKRFPDGANKDHLRATFNGLDTKNASAWIERAIQLPDADDAPTIPAPF